MTSFARRTLLARAAMTVVVSSLGAGAAHAADTIKIGEINSYKNQPAFLEPYKRGMELAVDEVNKAGGVNGKKLELITRDDNANPGDTVRVAEELIAREKVDVLAGGFLSNTGMALTDKMVWSNGNAYTFRLRPSTYMQVSMLVEEAVKLKKKRWAIVYPNYEYGQSSVATFKAKMKAAQPDIEFVTEQATVQGKVEAGSVVQALADAKPDAIFNVLFATDLTKFVREGNTRGLFKDRPVVSVLSGEPEYLDALKGETPDGWIVTGYPVHTLKTPEHKAFFDAYQARYKDYPRQGSVVGYTGIKSLAEGIRKAGSTETEALVKAFEGLEVVSPFGKITWRAQDHQSTMGAYVGRLKKVKGKGELVDYVYRDGKDYLPSDEEVKKLRPNP